MSDCGLGKSLVALGAMLVDSAERPFSAVVMSPLQLEKWTWEAFLTLSGMAKNLDD